MTKNYKPLKELCKEAGLKPIPFIPVSRELEAKIKREHGIKKRFLPSPPLEHKDIIHPHNYYSDEDYTK